MFASTNYTPTIWAWLDLKHTPGLVLVFIYFFAYCVYLFASTMSFRTRLNIGDEDCNLTACVIDEKAIEYCKSGKLIAFRAAFKRGF